MDENIIRDYLKNCFGMRYDTSKSFLCFLLSEGIYNAYIGRIARFRDDYENAPLECIDYDNVYKHSPSEVFRYGFRWRIFEPLATTKQKMRVFNYIKHFNSKLPKGKFWDDIDSRWKNHLLNQEHVAHKVNRDDGLVRMFDDLGL